MSYSPHEYVRHILAETTYILKHCANLTYARFVDDETMRRAVVRSLEIIGEASKQLTEEFRAEHPSIEWRAMAGLRDRLIHGYFGIDYELVWDVIEHHIPHVHRELLSIFPEHAQDGTNETRL
jgi:uncharacterized protein with HEPN domain